MRWIAAAIVGSIGVLFAACVVAEDGIGDLVCDAAFPDAIGVTNVPIVIKIDDKANVSIPMRNEIFIGKMMVFEDSLKGYVFDKSRNPYWAYFDRYNGTFSVSKVNLPPGGKVEVFGECKRAFKKF